MSAASKVPLILAATASVLLFIGLGIYLAPLQPGLVTLQLTFTPEAFANVLHAWGSDGVQRFRSHLPVDALLLLSYGCAGFLSVSRTHFFAPLAKRIPLHLIAALLPLAAVFDGLEDVLHWGLTSVDAVASGSAAVWYLAAGFAASLKWLGFCTFGLAAASARVMR